jgi:O-antigen/teichoic acid export membrane protein
MMTELRAGERRHTWLIGRVFSIDVGAKAITAAVTVLLIRVMVASEYAQYTVAFSICLFVIQALAMSFNRIYIVGFERLELSRLGGAFLTVQLLIVTVGALAVTILDPARSARYLGCYPLAITLMAVEYAKTTYQQELRFFRSSMVEVARAALFASALALFVVNRLRLTANSVIALQSASVAAAFVMIAARNVDWRGCLRVRSALRLMIRICAGNYGWLLLYAALLSLLSQADIFMLRLWSSDSEVATYGAGFRYYAMLSMALATVNTVLLPMVTRVKSAEELRVVLTRLRTMVLIVAPIIAVGAWLSQWIMPWLDAGKYPGAVQVFRILSASAIISFAFSPSANVLFYYERFGVLCLITTAGIIASVVASRILIPRSGATGGATATLIAFAIVNVGIFIYGWTTLRSQKQLNAES